MNLDVHVFNHRLEWLHVVFTKIYGLEYIFSLWRVQSTRPSHGNCVSQRNIYATPMKNIFSQKCIVCKLRRSLHAYTKWYFIFDKFLHTLEFMISRWYENVLCKIEISCPVDSIRWRYHIFLQSNEPIQISQEWLEHHVEEMTVSKAVGHCLDLEVSKNLDEG